MALLKGTFSQWLADNAQRRGAALAYYAAFSIPPLILIALAVAGLTFGNDAANGAVYEQLTDFIGPEASTSVEELVAGARKPAQGVVATIIGLAVLLFGASGVFGELQSSLNEIWGVQTKPGRGIWAFIKDRFLSFAMVLGIAFLLLVSLVISTMLTALGTWMSGILPLPPWAMQTLNFVVSFSIITLLFALIFKVLPDVRIGFRDVAIGAVVTAALFTVGKFALGLYLSTAAVGSSYGAAGSLVVVLVWVYYSAQILFFGAEFTKVYTQMYG
jgi:membrane protein